MRKLISEGLIDPECFAQNDSVAKEKGATGRYAIIGCAYPFINQEFMPSTLYKTNPEMHYLPLGPFKFADGSTAIRTTNGRSGSAVIIATKDCKDMDALVRLLEYANSDEGYTTTVYGIKGVHYDLKDGKPRLKAEWLEKYKADPKTLYDEGVKTTCYNIASLDRRKSLFGELNFGDADNVDPIYEDYIKARPLELVDGFRIDYFKSSYPGYDKLQPLLSQYTNTTGVRVKAMFAKSDAEALKILNDYRAQLIKSGSADYEKYCSEQAAKRNDIIW